MGEGSRTGTTSGVHLEESESRGQQPEQSTHDDARERRCICERRHGGSRRPRSGLHDSRRGDDAREPQERGLQKEVGEEEAMVAVADAGAKPPAVVVKPTDTPTAVVAVLGSRVLACVAVNALGQLEHRRRHRHLL